MRALLIDFDGTLADSMTLCYQVFIDFHRAHGREADRATFQRWVGPAIHEMIPQLCADWNEPIEKLLSEYLYRLDNAYQTSMQLYAGARVFLGIARQQGKQLALVTSAHRNVIERIIGNLGLHFDCVVTGDDVRTGKPDPAIYKAALRQLNITADEAVAIEDSPKGVQAARSAGIRCMQFAPEGQERIPGAELSFLHWEQVTQALLQPKCQRYPVSEDLRIEVSTEPYSLPAHIEEEISRIWDLERKRRPKIFNGKVFCCLERSPLVLRGHFLPYSYLLAQQIHPELREAIGALPVGVTGLARAAGHLLVGERSNDVTHYAGMRELAPSGVLDQGDWKQQVLRELQEETGLPEPLEIHPLCFVYDPIVHVLDLAVTLDLPAECLHQVPKPDDEHTRFVWMTRHEIDEAIEAEPSKWIPTAAALVP